MLKIDEHCSRNDSFYCNLMMIFDSGLLFWATLVISEAGSQLTSAFLLAHWSNRQVSFLLLLTPYHVQFLTYDCVRPSFLCVHCIC